jgi:hypothetical protein
MVGTTQAAPQVFFTLGQCDRGLCFVTPEGAPFFSLGLNHIDPATMRYSENIHIWNEKYGGSSERWIAESVAPNLKAWGFNSVGWVQEVAVRDWRHSRPFSAEEYRALDMPYSHMLPFTEAHQWERHTDHYDLRSPQWEEWCDYVARSHCAELSDDPNLMGYFYSDCPCWIHSRPVNSWRGSMFDPELLKTEAGRKELTELATIYYKTTHDAIRRYDGGHLIFGDRYEANRPIASEVIQAALPYVDVLSFQDFFEPVERLERWYRETGKPVLLADAAGIEPDTKPGEFCENDGNFYARVLEGLLKNEGCVGFHLCGAYQRNRARRYGLLDEMEQPDEKNIALIKEANRKAKLHMDGVTK